MTRMTGSNCANYVHFNTYAHNIQLEDQCERHRMARMAGPNWLCAI